jgi:hypothetical protein
MKKKTMSDQNPAAAGALIVVAVLIVFICGYKVCRDRLYPKFQDWLARRAAQSGPFVASPSDGGRSVYVAI